MKKILYIGIPASIIGIIFLFLQSCFSQNKNLPYNSTIPYYDVTISENNIREVQVEAILPLAKDTIRMSQIGDSPLKDGYAGFVYDLNATDTKGNSVRLALVGKGIWSVKAPVPSTIVIKYKVNIKHDNVNWTVSSAFARAYSVDGVLFFVGRTVFIAPAGADTSKIKVHYNLPKGWDIATPYAELRNDPNTFQARNLTDLWQNGNLIGKIVQQEINVGELHIIIAGSPSMKQGVEIFQKALTKIINSYQSEMGGAPEGKLVIMGSVSSLDQGGETFKNSISLMFPYPPSLSNKDQWGYLLAHEVFHLWNGYAISPYDQSQVEWFVEGFTEYMSKLTSYRTGFISGSEFLQQLAFSHDNYLNKAGKISLMEAGKQKGSNYSLIYDGGFTVALALDIDVRKLTNNKKGIIDIMNTMYSKFGKNKLPYKYEDIIKVSSEIAGTDLSGFFNAYISGVQVIPIDKYLADAGLEVSGQNGSTVIQPNMNASPGEKNLLKAMLSK